MSDCKHENHTIDMVCKHCGYDLIVDAMTERIQLAERERIIKLLEELIPAKPTYQMPMEYWVKRKLVEQAIALIKGEQKSQSEHLTDAIQTTVWAYEEGEQK